MNGIRNAIYVVILMVMCIGFAFVFGVGDEIMNALHSRTYMYPTAELMFQAWISIRDFFVLMSLNVALPFVLFTLFLSTFINHHTNVMVYVLQVFVLLMITPLLLYTFAGFLTNLMNMSIINPAYLQSLYVSNMLVILVVNLVLAAASFVFTLPGGVKNVVS